MTQKKILNKDFPHGTTHSRPTYTTEGDIPVIIKIPSDIHENVRQQKINRIYDILNPEISR